MSYINPNLIADLSKLAEDLNKFLCLADVKEIENPSKLEASRQILCRTLEDVGIIYGPGLNQNFDLDNAA
jgi:hypothetical protein